MLRAQYWDKLWNYSGRVAVSGTETTKCIYRQYMRSTLCQGELAMVRAIADAGAVRRRDSPGCQ